MRAVPIEISTIAPNHAVALAEFFESVNEDGSDKFFHPHAMTREAANERAEYVGEDLYFVMICNPKIIGYGMLRGWDEGHEIPTVGMIIHPDFRGKGLGGLFMNFLHVSAALRGAKEVLLHVDQRNEIATRLYRSLGYKITREKCHPELVGRLSLALG
jgi:[ribosomal protein S18]-alanine N-acetyltransferase